MVKSGLAKPRRLIDHEVQRGDVVAHLRRRAQPNVCRIRFRQPTDRRAVAG